MTNQRRYPMTVLSKQGAELGEPLQKNQKLLSPRPKVKRTLITCCLLRWHISGCQLCAVSTLIAGHDLDTLNTPPILRVAQRAPQNDPMRGELGIWFTNDLKECEVLNFSDFLGGGNTSFVQSMVKKTNNTTRQSSSSKIVDSI